MHGLGAQDSLPTHSPVIQFRLTDYVGLSPLDWKPLRPTEFSPERLHLLLILLGYLLWLFAFREFSLDAYLSAMAAAGQKRLREDDGSGLELDGAAHGVREHTLWVGSLDQKTTEYQLSRLFHPYGPLIRLDILYHKAGPHRGQPRGYGFVELTTRELASKAREKLDGFKLNGRNIAVRFVSDRILYDGGLPGGAGARDGGGLKEGREYRTDSEKELDRRDAVDRASVKGVATTQVLAATLDAKLAAIRARLRLGSSSTASSAPGGDSAAEQRRSGT